MNSPKLSSSSKKLSKVRRNRAKKPRISSQTLNFRRKPELFFTSEHCARELVAFRHFSRFPAPLRTIFTDFAQLFRVFSVFKRVEAPTKLENQQKNLENARFLAQSQEDFVERLLRKKYEFTQESQNLQEICCYVSAKELLKSQFLEFFAKRSEFFSKNQSFLQNCNGNVQVKLEEKLEKFEENRNKKSEENFEENSFSTANVSSPSLQNFAFFKEKPQVFAKETREIFSFQEEEEANIRFF